MPLTKRSSVDSPGALLKGAQILHVRGIAPPMVSRLVRFWAWLAAGQCRIRNIWEREVALYPNRAQTLLFTAWLLQALQGKPIRCVVLKARKLGVSTFVQAWDYFCCRHYPQQIASTLAHEAESTQEIFRITQLIGERDIAGVGPRLNRSMLVFAEMQSRYWCHTAGGEGVGAGGTPNMLHLSEVALWKKNKRETHYTATNAIPFTATSCIVQESTARGIELFYDLFTAAGAGDHPYESVFIPWFYDERLSVPVGDDFELTDTEAEIALLAEQHGIVLSAETMQWRRMKIAELGPAIFKQEFPSTPDEAIEGEKGRVLPGLRNCVIQELPFAYGLTEWQEERVGGIDFGFHDYTVFVLAVYRDQILYVIDLYRTNRALMSEHAVNLVNGHRYYCDPSELQSRKDLYSEARKLGLDVLLHKAPVSADRTDLVRSNSEWRQVATLFRQGRIKLLPSAADQLILEADNFLWSETTGKPDKVRGEKWGHFDSLDALRYLVMGVVGRGEPISEHRQTTEQPVLSRRDSLRLM